MARQDLMSNVLEIVQPPAAPIDGALARDRDDGGGGEFPRNQRLYPARQRPAQRRSVRRVVARRKKNLVFLEPKRIWAFEASDRLTFVHSPEGRFAIDLSLAAIEAAFGRALFRVHRNWLVNLAYVKELVRDLGGATLIVGSDLRCEGGRCVHTPISQDRAKAVRDALLKDATGLRRP
jgi:DNA-binding LytR/AlgR family response regulator